MGRTSESLRVVHAWGQDLAGSWLLVNKNTQQEQPGTKAFGGGGRRMLVTVHASLAVPGTLDFAVDQLPLLVSSMLAGAHTTQDGGDRHS